MDKLINDLQANLEELKIAGNYRSLAHAVQEGRYLLKQGECMLNLSSNDYLGLAADHALYAKFLHNAPPEYLIPSSSSSRLLTGNHPVFDELEVAPLPNAATSSWPTNWYTPVSSTACD